MLPPVVTGAVVMLIGFNLAPVVANIYWPQDQWVALATMAFVIVVAVGARGFIGRIAVFLGLLFGYLLSWLLDLTAGPITSILGGASAASTHDRVDWSGVVSVPWFGFPPKTEIVNGHEVVGWHLPDFKVAFVLLVLPAVIALVAENAGHVKAVAEMTGKDLDPVMGRAIGADGAATVIADRRRRITHHDLCGEHRGDGRHPDLLHGRLLRGRPGVHWVRLLTEVRRGGIGHPGWCARRHHRGAVRHDRPARGEDWKENRVDFGLPINLVPIAAGIIIAIGNTSLVFSDSFSLSGIALGTIVAIAAYHVARWVAGGAGTPETAVARGRPATPFAGEGGSGLGLNQIFSTRAAVHPGRGRRPVAV